MWSNEMAPINLPTSVLLPYSHTEVEIEDADIRDETTLNSQPDSYVCSGH